VKKLNEIFEPLSQQPVAFIIKGSPDPDALACSFALLKYYKTLGGEGVIYHADAVSNSLNKAMINILDIKITESNLSNIQEQYYILCDHCNPIIDKVDPKKCLLHIDHHHNESDIEKMPSTCTQIIEYEAGACSSIVTKLLDEVKFFETNEITNVATALSYGIKTDTDNLDSARVKDFEAMKILSQHCNRSDLQRITKTRISTQTADVLTKALSSKKKEQNWLYAGVGYLQETYRDSIALVADEMMRIAGIDSVLVYAIIEKGDTAVVEGSIRSVDAGFDIDHFVKNFSQNAGGRKFKGGFQIPLGFWANCANRNMLEDFVRTTIECKFKSILGIVAKEKDEK
jgi:nanoRNase/pAp phosphatase (c-di-AMP/oligoRNAs hydrolase)